MTAKGKPAQSERFDGEVTLEQTGRDKGLAYRVAFDRLAAGERDGQIRYGGQPTPYVFLNGVDGDLKAAQNVRENGNMEGISQGTAEQKALHARTRVMPVDGPKATKAGAKYAVFLFPDGVRKPLSSRPEVPTVTLG